MERTNVASTKLSRRELREVDGAAALLGETRSEFLRRAAIEMANRMAGTAGVRPRDTRVLPGHE